MGHQPIPNCIHMDALGDCRVRIRAWWNPIRWLGADRKGCVLLRVSGARDPEDASCDLQVPTICADRPPNRGGSGWARRRA